MRVPFYCGLFIPSIPTKIYFNLTNIYSFSDTVNILVRNRKQFLLKLWSIIKCHNYAPKLGKVKTIDKDVEPHKDWQYRYPVKHRYCSLGRGNSVAGVIVIARVREPREAGLFVISFLASFSFLLVLPTDPTKLEAGGQQSQSDAVHRINSFHSLGDEIHKGVQRIDNWSMGNRL